MSSQQSHPFSTQGQVADKGSAIAFGPHERLCFYPSCGNRTLWALLRLDCDLFVMADKWFEVTSWKRIQAKFIKQKKSIEKIDEAPGYVCFRSQGKTVWIFREDNRLALQRLADQGLKIHHFVGICDGCMEGGNYECVHERPFMSHVLSLAAEGMRYTTDHSRPLQKSWYYGMTNRKFMSSVLWCDFPEADSRSGLCGVESHEIVPPNTRFDLQGVLVKTDGELSVLPKGEFPTELARLKAFRTIYDRGILAEYRVEVPAVDDEPSGTRGIATANFRME
ncbi:MAG: hypothetical protein IV103_13675 [Zoogloea sp.]|nr:hypothetical protein [Zoogloea sp.]